MNVNIAGKEFNIGRKKSVIDRIHMESIGILNVLDIEDAFAVPRQTGEITAELAAKIYSASPWVYAATRIIATALASVPLRVYRVAPNSEIEEVKRGYPYVVLDFVNPQMTKSQLMEYTASWLTLNGNAYWAIEETPKGYEGYSSFSIYPLNPKYTFPVPSSDIGEAGVIYRIAGYRIFIPASRLVHFKNFSPHDYWYGHSGLNPLNTDMQVERFGKRQMANFFSHAAVVSGVLNISQDIHEDEVRKLKKEFYAQYGGARNAYRVMVLTNGMTYDPLKANMADFQTVPVLQSSLESHSTVLGVPIAVLYGKTERGEKVIEVEALMWKKTIIPLGKLIAETITKNLALPISPKGQYTDNLIVDFDYTNVEALRTQDLDRTRVEVASVLAGLTSPNDVRQGRGRPHWTGKSAEFGDMATPVYNAEQAASLATAKTSASMGLPGSQGGRDQSANGEAQMADTTGQRNMTMAGVIKDLLRE